MSTEVETPNSNLFFAEDRVAEFFFTFFICFLSFCYFTFPGSDESPFILKLHLIAFTALGCCFLSFTEF